MRLKNDWLPYDLAGRANVCRNIRGKIDNYATQFGLTVAQTDRIKEICDAFVYAYQITFNAENSMKALVAWRRSVMDDRRKIGQTADEPPSFFIGAPPPGMTYGLIAELRKYVAIIKVSPGYTRAAGADLEILPPSPSQMQLAEISPKLQLDVRNGTELHVRCVMRTMDALRLEYSPAGTEREWRTIGFLTTMPATIKMKLPENVTVEAGYVRGIFMKKNKDVGRMSPEMNITLRK